MQTEYWFLLAGVALGWVTKVPFLFRLHREIEREHRGMREMVARHVAYLEKRDAEGKYAIRDR